MHEGCRRSRVTLEVDIHALARTRLVLLLSPRCRWPYGCGRLRRHGGRAEVARRRQPLRGSTVLDCFAAAAVR